MNTIANRYGSLAGLIIISAILLGMNLDSKFLKPIMLLVFFGYIGCIIFSIHSQAKTANGNWQVLFGTGFKTSLIAIVVTLSFIFIGVKLYPKYKQDQIKFKTERLQMMQTPQTEIDQDITSMNKHFIIIKMGQVIGMLLTPGILFAAIAAFGLKSKFNQKTNPKNI
jgi:Protein of unknown function (DUF4199)